MEKKNNDSSDRRRFIRKLAKLGAVSGIATLLFGRLDEKMLIPQVQASPAYLTIDAVNTGIGKTELDSSGAGGAFVAEATADTGLAYGVVGYSNSTSGIGVAGYVPATSGSTRGVSGSSNSVYGTGVYGYAIPPNGPTLGVYGESASTDGTGVKGNASAPGGLTYGVYGLANSTSGTGVYGEATAISGETRGVYGKSNSPSGVGVKGYAYASSGTAKGVLGQSDSTDGAGVFGFASTYTGTSAGVSGLSQSTSGMGVMGIATASIGETRGVCGRSDSSSGIGVLGWAGNAGTKPIVARGASSQTASLQEWQDNAGTALSAISKDGWMGIGIANPARQLHIQGNQGVSRMDRDVDSAAFIFVRTAPGDFNTVLKSFMFGADARGVNDGRFVVGDLGTAVSGVSTKRLVIENDGKVGIGTESPTEMLHVIGKVRTSGGLITGDIEFANGVKATEEGEGLAFVNPQGTKVALLDSEGNLHVKGKVIQDL